MPKNAYVLRSLQKFGRDLRSARMRRRLPSSVVAERAGISRNTLLCIENGSGGVSLANVAAALYALGLLERFDELADQRNDSVGLLLDEERLPRKAYKTREHAHE